MSQDKSIIRTFSDGVRPLRTPIIKVISAVTSSSKDQSNDVYNHPPIIMDEYGQTPDHFYLAKNPPKPPPTLYQVKRRLDLESSKLGVVDSSRSTRSKRRKQFYDGMKPKVKSSVDKARYDTSLGQLTKKFLKLLTDASDGVVNLNKACTLLSVPKRRIYDITNVLEGAGLLQKTSRNNIQWKGGSSSSCESIMKYELEREIDVLEAKENKLDELIYHVKSEIATIKDSDARYHYVTSEDLKDIKAFSDQTLIGVSTSQSLRLESTGDTKLRLTSKNGEIETYLLTENTSFMNILHPRAKLKDKTYSIQIENRYISNFETEVKRETCTKGDAFLGRISTPEKKIDTMLLSSAPLGKAKWSEADAFFKNAFISEEDDIAPMGKHFLLQTEDQDLDSSPFSQLDHPVDDYSFSLDEGEGLTDLFDCCGFPCP